MEEREQLILGRVVFKTVHGSRYFFTEAPNCCEVIKLSLKCKNKNKKNKKSIPLKIQENSAIS